MQEFVAAFNLTIQCDNERWELYSGRGEGTDLTTAMTPIVSAERGGFSYQSAFATARKLPFEGVLAPDRFTMVVVGWAAEDASWHLGVLVDPELAEARGGRWCGLAMWPADRGEMAREAGMALARVLARPFRFVAPEGIQTFAPSGAEVPLMALPINLGDWILRDDPVGLKVERTASWKKAAVIRTLIFLVLTPAFGVLSFGALLSSYAPVQPEWLPYAGLALTAILLLVTITQVRPLLRGPITLIDRRNRMIRQNAGVGRRIIVQSPFEGLEYVLVSHVLNRRKAIEYVVEETGESQSGFAFWAEIWIHLFSPRRGFIELCHITDLEGRLGIDDQFSERRPLNLAEINSPAHHAAMAIAKEIDLPIYIEAR